MTPSETSKQPDNNTPHWEAAEGPALTCYCSQLLLLLLHPNLGHPFLAQRFFVSLTFSFIMTL